ARRWRPRWTSRTARRSRLHWLATTACWPRRPTTSAFRARRCTAGSTASGSGATDAPRLAPAAEPVVHGDRPGLYGDRRGTGAAAGALVAVALACAAAGGAAAAAAAAVSRAPTARTGAFAVPRARRQRRQLPRRRLQLQRGLGRPR